ncbi:MAG TPA: isoprenylcysteine carboxylmethyltransferase family protein [Anaerolineales bacterium]|jgi:protein-S-isoprenylcysteine O-methyltransferase Ste14|nr:isoprenylcysteine carboxylmethyltransferase family protein [Anaerolineales bacterium]
MTQKNSDHPQVMVPPPLIFLGYLLGALILNWAVPFSTPWIFLTRVVGGVLAAIGFFLGGWAFSQMVKAHTSPDPREATTAIVTSGPYRFTRNPIYLGFFLIYLGFTIFAGTLWGILASPFLFWTVTHSVIHAEEIYLEDKFGEEFASYRSRVRQWL